MNEKQIRLECYRSAGEIKGLFSTLKTPQEELATQLADFCRAGGSDDDDLYLEAIRMAVKSADRRADGDSIIARAKEILSFAIPPAQKSSERNVPIGRRGKKKTSR